MSPSRGRPAGTEGDRHPDRMTRAIPPHLPPGSPLGLPGSPSGFLGQGP